MSYTIIYKDAQGNTKEVLALPDPIYNDILNTIQTSKSDRNVLEAITDFLPTDVSDAFRQRMQLD